MLGLGRMCQSAGGFTKSRDRFILRIMLRLILLILGTSALCVWLSGCFFGGPPSSYRGDVNTDIYLALDIEGTVQLRYASELRNQPSSILELSASKSSGLKWREPTTDVLGIEFKLHGTKLGTHDLMVRYRDDEGRKRKQIFHIHVVEFDHAVERFSCDGSVDGPPYFVAPGAQFRANVSAFDADNNLLPTGELQLITDADGFEYDGVWRTWLAPEEPGTYTWSLAGKEERSIDVVVYDPADLMPSITVPTRAASEQARVVVDLGLELRDEAGPVCIGPVSGRVDVDVVEGECLPEVGSLSFQDGLSLDVSGGAQSVVIAGKDSCTVRVASPQGASVEATLNADVSVSDLNSLALNYQMLDGEEVFVMAAPKVSVVADREWGECGIYSVTPDFMQCPYFYLSASNRSGCIRKTEWTLEYVDLHKDIEYVATGVGLVGELTFRLDAKGGDSSVDGLDMQPTALTFAPQFDALSWTALGCTDTRRILQFSASAPMNYDFTLDAANATEQRELIIRAQAIAQTTLRVTGAVTEADPSAEEEAIEPPPTVRLHDGASTQHWFVGHAQTLELAYFNEEGEPLRGVGGISVGSSDEDSEAGVQLATDYREFGVFAGTRRNVVEVSSPHAPAAHRIVVEDEDGIAGMFGLDVVRFTEETLHCVTLRPLSDDGLLISGSAPILPRVRGTRDKLVVSVSDDAVPRACFQGHTEGDADLTWSWGAAEQSVTWTVE